VTAVTSEALKEGRKLFLAQKQWLDVRRKHCLLQTLPKELRCWQVLQAEEGTNSYLPPKNSAVSVPRLDLVHYGPVTLVQCYWKLVLRHEKVCEIKPYKIRKVKTQKCHC